MGDDTPQTVMNLDLNLGPVVHRSHENEPRGLTLDDWLDGPVREAINHRTIARQRWRSIWRPVLFPIETRTTALDLITGIQIPPGSSETGEGSLPARSPDPPKTLDTSNAYPETNSQEEREKNIEKSQESQGGFFDCNICLEISTDPVVTSCGHLFCWPCLYKWLHIHDSKECPICKGETSIKNLTPIYGRGNPTRVVESDPGLKIPGRPKAKRVESWRQTIQRNAFTMPMEEMIRRLGSRFDLTRDLVAGQNENAREVTSNSLLDRYLSSRGFTNNSLSDRAEPTRSDRDSVSSIAAVIQSESQTVDIEIDSSRRRSEASSRVSDVDSGDSRASRRRRLH